MFNALNGIVRSLQGPSVNRGTRNATVVAVAAQKGGVGKTTSAVHFAAGLARFHGRRVLLIDMDAQGHVGASLRREASASTGDALSKVLLERKRDIQEIVRPTATEGLWIVPSDTGLAETERLLAARIGKELRLRQALAIARTHFDTIVIDCPPNQGGLTVNALVAADRVLIPCDLSVLSLDGVESILETVATVQDTLNPGLELLGVVRTRVDRRNQTVNREIEDKLERRFGSWLLDTAIGTSTEITKAQLAGESVYGFAPRGRASKAYQAMSAELDRRLFGHIGPN